MKNFTESPWFVLFVMVVVVPLNFMIMFNGHFLLGLFLMGFQIQPIKIFGEGLLLYWAQMRKEMKDERS